MILSIAIQIGLIIPYWDLVGKVGQYNDNYAKYVQVQG